MKILVINPGATSTKIAVFDETAPVYQKNIAHSPADLDRFAHVIDQADYRLSAVLDAVSRGGFALDDFDAVCGRGGLYRPIPGGTYLVNDAVMHDVETAPYGEHASNLGAYLARKVADRVGIRAYFVDPVCTDELTEVAHYTGFAPLRRLSQFHALNQKSVGRKAAAMLGKPYEQARLIVCHLGGGVSVGAHLCGRIVDTTNPRDDGAMALDRGGTLPVQQVVDYCFSGVSHAEAKKTLGHRSGMFSYVGTTDFKEICAKVAAGDPVFTEAYRALVYQLSKDIGTMAAVLHFQVDAVVFTGGMAYSEMFCHDIADCVGSLAPTLRIPGEEEMRSLADGALRVLHGQQAAQV